MTSQSKVASGDGTYSPVVDIEDADDAWVLEADLPGIRNSKISFELSDSELAVTGAVEESKRRGLLRGRTRRTRRFEYRVTLPADADSEKIDASLNLVMRIPKLDMPNAAPIPLRQSGPRSVDELEHQ